MARGWLLTASSLKENLGAWLLGQGLWILGSKDQTCLLLSLNLACLALLFCLGVLLEECGLAGPIKSLQ